MCTWGWTIADQVCATSGAVTRTQVFLPRRSLPLPPIFSKNGYNPKNRRSVLTGDQIQQPASSVGLPSIQFEAVPGPVTNSFRECLCLVHCGAYALQCLSAKSLPCRLARNTQRRPNLGPADFALPKNVHDLLELIALALKGILDRLQVSQQALSG